MSVALHELFCVSSEAAARVRSQVACGDRASDALLDDLAASQRMCLNAMHARLRQKISILDLTSSFTSRLPSPAFVSDFSDMEQCMRYAVKCCEECRSPEQMRQLVPLLRCLQCDSPNNSALMPLFAQLGGVVAVLAWSHRTATQLSARPDSLSMAVLTGVLQIVSKFNVLPKQTVPSGACKLLLDIMSLRLPPVSACVAAILRCWMKCAERHASATARDSPAVPLKPKLASPAARPATVLNVNRTAASVGRAAAPPPAARSADGAASGSHKMVAELCEDEQKDENIVHQPKRPRDISRLPAASPRPSASAAGDASHPSQRLPAPSSSRSLQTPLNQSAPSGLAISRDLSFFQSSYQTSDDFLYRQHSAGAPAAFDALACAHALDSLALILQHDASSAFMRGEGSQLLLPSQDRTYQDASASAEQGFAELFVPPAAAQDGDFFRSEDQFFADDVTMSSDAINRAFLAALREFSHRDELSGLQSLCAKFRS